MTVGLVVLKASRWGGVAKEKGSPADLLESWDVEIEKVRLLRLLNCWQNIWLLSFCMSGFDGTYIELLSVYVSNREVEIGWLNNSTQDVCAINL